MTDVIETLHPKVQPIARQLVKDARAKGIETRILAAPEGFGLAFDAFIFRGSKPALDSPHYQTLGHLGKTIGLAWGGDKEGITQQQRFTLRPDWAKHMGDREMIEELRRRHDAGADVVGGLTHPVLAFVKTRQPVSDHGEPPTELLVMLVQWGRQAPKDIFETRPDPAPPHEDIYTTIKPKLGPWRGEKHRRAVMLEVLRVMAGLAESGSAPDIELTARGLRDYLPASQELVDHLRPDAVEEFERLLG